MVLSAQTQTHINQIIDEALQDGRSLINFCGQITRGQVSAYVTYLFGKKHDPITAVTERALSKSLFWFLHELAGFRAAHYSVIRDIVKKEHGFTVNDYATLQYFKLITPTNVSGEWKVTKKGFEFLTGVTTVPASVSVRNGEVVAQSPRLVSVADFEELAGISYAPIEQRMTSPRNENQI